LNIRVDKIGVFDEVGVMVVVALKNVAGDC